MTERQTIERNQRNLIIEVFWAAIFAGCVSFNAAYLIRLGGSNLLVSLLSSGAALINAIAALPFAAFLERRARRKPWIVGSLAAVRFGHLGLIGIPCYEYWFLSGAIGGSAAHGRSWRARVGAGVRRAPAG